MFIHKSYVLKFICQKHLYMLCNPRIECIVELCMFSVNPSGILPGSAAVASSNRAIFLSLTAGSRQSPAPPPASSCNFRSVSRRSVRSAESFKLYALGSLLSSRVSSICVKFKHLYFPQHNVVCKVHRFEDFTVKRVTERYFQDNI